MNPRYRMSPNNARGTLILLLIIIAAVTLTNILNTGFTGVLDWLTTKLVMLPGIIIGVTIHEFGHAAVSSRLGDPTPKRQGRLSLNPLRHFDLVGFFCLLLVGFGWGVPVEIDPRYYKNRRSGEILVGFAGVVLNLITAVAAAFILRGLLHAEILTRSPSSTGQWIALMILVYIISINVTLCVFNLLPIPPLDGFGILSQIFHFERYSWYEPFRRWGIYILLLLVALNLVSPVITPPSRALLNLILRNIAGMA